MSSHRKPWMSAARKRTRAVTLCAATLGAAALPSLAQAATSGSTSIKPVQPEKPAHAVSTPATTTQSIFVSVSDSTKNTKKTQSTTTKSTSTKSVRSYTVVAGDTLFGIAKATLGNGADYPEIFKLNKDETEADGRTFTDANLIYPDWRIRLPASATVPTTTTGTTSSSSSSSGYANNLDGWINQAISILAQHGYTVSYNAIYQTAINESGGNPNAENNWDSNAAAGTPSIGLLQVIQPTFDTYALPGYGDIWNPVDNIIAAAIYAQVTYGGLDNVVAARCGGSCWYGY